MKPTLVILAAGIGRRFGGLKQLEPVGPEGATIIDYSVFDALRTGFGKIVFVCRAETLPMLQSSIGQRIEPRITVEYVLQRLDDLPAGLAPPPGRTKPWGTGQAVLATENAVHEPFGVVNADDFYGVRAFLALSSFLQTSLDALPRYALVGYHLAQTLAGREPVNRAVCECTGEWLRSITEIIGITPLDEFCQRAAYQNEHGMQFALPGHQVVSMNMWGFTRVFFAQLRAAFTTFVESSCKIDQAEFYLPGMIQSLLDSRQAVVRVIPSNSPWCGLTHPDDQPRVARFIEELIARGEYPEELWP